MSWYPQRIDDEDGEIRYEAHDASTAHQHNSAWAMFEGVGAKQLCEMFIEMMNKRLEPK